MCTTVMVLSTLVLLLRRHFCNRIELMYFVLLGISIDACIPQYSISLVCLILTYCTILRCIL
uniref:Uncharacterized protein n=1 Tax=Electrophorus electricus TaxID=8005 RepID=A0A4W4FEA4_ELEEL